jgi:gluconokinase
VRALLFDAGGRRMEGYGAQLAYHVRTAPDGAAAADPDVLVRMAVDCLDEVHRQTHEAGLRIAAVAGSAFWHGLMGTDAAGRPTIPLIHLFDTRSDPFVERVPDVWGRTGCPRHASYWPTKLAWLRFALPAEFAATRRWMSLPEFLFTRLFGRPRESVSMVSATGLWNYRANDYDFELLQALNVRRDQLSPVAELDATESELLPEYRRMWPGFKNTTWFPLLGDGAANNLGSGCLTPDSFSLMVGTTGAMRAVLEKLPPAIAPGLWCYRVDRKRFVVGGALSNGGEVYAWMKRTLVLPKDIEARLEKAVPGTHELRVLPFFSGERTPYWRGDLRAVIAGLTLATEPFDILRASLEAVSIGFRQIYGLLSGSVGVPRNVIASGGALVRSAGWTQMMADALGRPVIASLELEASARGAALWALEQLGTRPVSAFAPSCGATFQPRPEFQDAYEHLVAERNALYREFYDAKA